MSDCNNIPGGSVIVISEPQLPYCEQCGSNDCVEIIDSQCVIYHSLNNKPTQLENLGMINGATAEEIFEAIDDLIGNGANISLTVVDTSTIDFTTSGPAGHNLTGFVKLSETAFNLIQRNSDGLWVGETAFSATDSSSIDFTTSGSYGHTLTGAVKISETAGNIITLEADGIFAEATAISALLATNGLTVTGTNPQTVKLGGALIENTVITGAAGTYDLSFTGLDTFTTTATNNITVTSSSGNVVLTGNNINLVTNGTTGNINMTGSITYNSDLTPPQITANEDNYAPAGITGASVLRLSSDASRNITGMGVVSSDCLTYHIFNVGAFNIVLKNEDVSSGATGRFLLHDSVDITLKPNSGITIMYDATSQRWRALSAVVI